MEEPRASRLVGAVVSTGASGDIVLPAWTFGLRSSGSLSMSLARAGTSRAFSNEEPVIAMVRPIQLRR